MTLATRCPDCGTTFRVVSDQLKLRKGLVKCGKCTHVFNGVEHLRYYSADEASVSTIVALPTRPPDSDETPVEPGHAAVAGAIDDRHETRAQRAAISRIDEELARDLPLSPPPPEAHDAPTRRLSARGPRTDARDDSWFGRPARRDASMDPLSPLTLLDLAPDGTQAANAPIDHYELPGFLNERRRPRWMSALLASGIAAAAVALFAQSTYVWRAELAATWPSLRSPIAQTCAALLGTARCDVDLPHHITRLRIGGAELQAARKPGQYALLITLHNDSSLPQAWPTLDVVLSDVRNVPVTRRSIVASEYLRDRDDVPARLRNGLAAGADESFSVPLSVDAPVEGYTVGIYYP